MGTIWGTYRDGVCDIYHEKLTGAIYHDKYRWFKTPETEQWHIQTGLLGGYLQFSALSSRWD
jgi:hypothetical protein